MKDRILNLIKILYRRIIFEIKKNKYCPVCNSKTHFFIIPIELLKMWQKYGFVYSIFDFETLNVIEYSCAKCCASDRDRLYALYFIKNFKRDLDLKVLDIGYSEVFKKFIIKNYPNIYYDTLDKFNNDAKYKLDVEDMNELKDETYDFVICSHVLEHVVNPEKAVKEIYRVLKKKGQAIIMVPILLSIKNTIENPSYNTEELRWKYYGQGDHLRIYSKNDFLKLLYSVGFKVNELGVNYFGRDTFNKSGITQKSVLYLCKKNNL